MKQDYIIRNEKPEDFRKTEELTKKAFWNVNTPGCNEHYLAHVMRSHSDFIPELDLVMEKDNKIIGNVMYVKSKLINKNGLEKEILTFGPISILPEYQRQGYGKALLEASFAKAVEMEYDVIVIFGNPDNYVGRGFKSGRKYNVSLEGGVFPTALLVKELKADALKNGEWVYRESEVYNLDESAADEFDKQFEPLEKAHEASQELFYILNHSTITYD